MKKMILTMVAALTMTTATMAQDNNQQGQRPERRFDKTEMVKRRTAQMVDRYGLNDKQAADLLALNTKYADQMGPRRGGPGRPGMRPGANGQKPEPKDSLKPKKGQKPAKAEKKKDGNAPKAERPDSTQRPPRPQGGADREQVMKAYNADLQKILTTEQYQKYQADEQQRRQQRPQGQRQGRPGNRQQ